MAVSRWQDHVQTGDHASRPAASATAVDALYACTDHDIIYQSDGSSTWSTYFDADVSGALTTHEADTTSAHTAEGVDIVDVGGIITATNVEDALQEIQTALDVEEAAAPLAHATSHSDGGSDEVTVENLATAAVDTSYALKPDGAGGVAFGAVSAVGSIDDLSDVDTDKSKTPADGDVLTYDGTDWNAEAAAGGGGSALTVTDESGTVSDTAVTSITVPDGTLVDNGTGDVTLREVPTGTVVLNVTVDADQTVSSGTWTQRTFSTASTDTEGGWSDANDEYTVPAGMSGWYYYSVQTGWDADSNGMRYVAMRVDDLQEGKWYADEGTLTNQDGPARSGLIHLEAGETVQVYVYQDKGSDLDCSTATLQLVKLGSGTVGEAIGATVYDSGTQSIADSSNVAVEFDSEVFDTDGFHDTVTNNSRLTIPAGLGGTYYLRVRATFAANATGYRQMGFRQDGTTYLETNREVSPDGTTGEVFNAHTIVQLEAGEYIEAYVRQTSGGNLNIGDASNADLRTQLDIIRLGGGGGGGTDLTVDDDTGSVSATEVSGISFPEGTVTDNGDNTVTVRTVPSGVVGVSVYHSAVQSITGSTATALLFDSETKDTDGFHDTVTNNSRLTVPAGMGGVYDVWATVQIGAMTTAQAFFTINVNGTAVSGRYGYGEAAGTGGNYLSGSKTLWLNAGDYVEVELTHTHASAQDAGHASIFEVQNQFGMVKLGSGTVGETIGAAAEDTGTQSIATSTWTPLELDTPRWDTDGYLTSTTDFTIPAGLGGKYLVTALAEFAINSTGYRQIAVTIDGTPTYVIGRDIGDGTSPCRVVGAGVFEFAAGQVIQVEAYQNSGGNLNVGNAGTARNRVELTLLATQGSDGSTPVTGDDHELDYVEITSNVNVTATAEATPQDVVTGSAVEYDGSTEVEISFYAPSVKPDETTSGNNVQFFLYDGTSSLGSLAFIRNDNGAVGHNVPVLITRRLTPSSGSHTYKVGAIVNSGSATVTVGAGGTGNFVPGFLRITRANPRVNAYSGQGITSGASFPASPVTGDRYRRSDLGYDVYYYDGTRWLSETEYSYACFVWDQSAAGIIGFKAFDKDGLDIRLTRWDVGMAVDTTNGASDHWNLTCYSSDVGGSGGTGTTTFGSTDSHVLGTGIDNHQPQDVALSEQDLDVSVDGGFHFYVSKDGSPGDLRVSTTLYFRKVAT